MKSIHLIAAACLPELLLNACAPGKAGGGGIGCSKTSSVLKTPSIVVANSETQSTFDPATAVSAEDQRLLFFKHFGQFRNKIAGGYLYIQSRSAGDQLGQVPELNSWHRCSVQIEFPKRTGEIRAPSIAGSPWSGKSNTDIEADRFPVRTDALKIRLYTAAHCFDFSLNERVVLSVFNVQGQTLPDFNNAYINIDVTIPELEAVKNLRLGLKEKVTTNTITNQNAVDILSAFQPSVRDMSKVFGVDPSSPPTSPSPKQSCILTPADVGDAKQYTCGTYHDMAVFDVLLNNLSTKVDTDLRDLRDKSVQNLKNLENDNPDLASSTSAPNKSPWKEYAENPGFRMFVGDALRPDCTVTSPFDSSAPSSCNPNLYPADPTMVDPMNPTLAYPKVYTIKFSCDGVAAPDCDEVPIHNLENLHFMRYSTRERLRSFSRYNMVGSLPRLESITGLLACGTNTTGICSTKNDIQTALNEVAPNLSLTTASLSSSNFTSSSSPFVKAQKKVDGALAVWKDFLDANAETNDGTWNPDTGSYNVSGQADFLKKQLNPINFLDLNSNFVVQDRSLTTLPDPKDMLLRRSFLNLPINNIIGLNEITSPTLDSTSNPRPIYIDSWSSTDGDGRGGRFLRFWTTKNQLNSFLDNFALDTRFGDHFSAADPSSYVVIFDKATVNPLIDFITPIPTQATLQKGDSGSIFTLDGIPMFALSTVNGEPTSGGAAVNAIPVGGADTDDAPPVVAGAGGGTDGGTVVSSGSKSVGAVCK
jgi:hypothetical protein